MLSHVRLKSGRPSKSTAPLLLMKFAVLTLFMGLVASEVPLYIPADLPCSDLWSHHIELGASGGGESIVWEEAGDMCNLTYRGVAVSTPEGRTTVSYNTTFQVHKELLSQVLNTVLRVRERYSRQVGDPFITPYLAGVYQRLGLEYSSLFCFTRVTLMWRRIAAARSAVAATVVATVAAAPASSVTSSAPPGASAASDSTTAATEASLPSSSTSSSPTSGHLFASRVVPLHWHVQQLHRELVLEPWKAADLRLMLVRAAAYAEAQVAAGAHAVAAGSACTYTGDLAGGGGGLVGRWLRRHANALVGGGLPLGGYHGGGRHGQSAACRGGSGRVSPLPSSSWAGLDLALFWLMWVTCPTMLVALEALQAAPDNPWMALYICAIATCHTLAEWRAAAAVARVPGLTLSQRLYGLAAGHMAVGMASAVMTGLLISWLPLLGHGAATAVVWLHLLLLPAVMIAVMSVAGMPLVARQLAGGGRPAARGGGADSNPRRNGVHDHRDTGGGSHGGGGGAAADSLGSTPGGQALRDGDRGGGGGSGSGGVGRSGASAAAAAASQVHWPPALDVPAWLDDWPNAPEAFRCPITQSVMREPAQASSGVTYERPAIMQWLDHRRIDPVTHVPLKRHRLAPNLNLRHMIEVWVQDRVEARRRLAQRLLGEVSIEAAAMAAASSDGEADANVSNAASGGGATTAAGTSNGPSTSRASHRRESAKAGTRTGPGPVAKVAAVAERASSAASDEGVVVPAAVLEAVAVATMGSATGAVEAAQLVLAGPEQAAAAAAATGTATTYAGESSGGGDEGGGGGGGGGFGFLGTGLGGTASEAAQVQAEEVEAAAVLAARERVGFRRRCLGGLGGAGCGTAGIGGSGGYATVYHRNSGGARRRAWSSVVVVGGGGGMAAEAVDTDDAAEADGADGAVSAGSGESPFGAPLSRDSSGADAEAEPGTDPQDTEASVGGGGSAGGSDLRDLVFGADGIDGVPNAESYHPAGAAFQGLRQRHRHTQLGSAGGGAASVAAHSAAALENSHRGSLLRQEPNWGMVWVGAETDSSGVLAVDGSDTNTVPTTVAASAATAAVAAADTMELQPSPSPAGQQPTVN